ncbi:hypothetical protein MHM89_18760 [Pseudoalteromonas sp. CNC9-20]|uniref:hypothetical protein n=1 Tax=Pseudoalteromonas sp. CNC9-20 TaxID=2917750 RepID=UPI001EF3DD5D|nr:hypothetical protein [Pseudoalteromonas sp. CNC9-20]MCG7571941.1 hypothetical protein [Pseudoalteromonas sp. CNC9-20]
MHISLFDSRPKETIKTIQSMLNYPIEFFTHSRNKNTILELCGANPIATNLVKVVIFEIEQVCTFVDFKVGSNFEGTYLGSSINTLKIAQSTVLSSITSDLKLDNQTFSQYKKELEVKNAEDLSGISILNVDDEGLKIIVSKLLDIVWIVNHLSLYFLGAVKLDADKNGSVIFSVTTPELFHNLWFASAFEKKSIVASTVAIKKYAELTLTPESVKENIDSVNLLHARVLSIFAQHWRLGADELILSIFHELADLVLILTKVVQVESFSIQGVVVNREYYQELVKVYPEREGILNTYDMVVEHQLNLAPEDRLFNIINGDLRLGDVETIRGMLSQAQFFSEKRFGQNWNKDLERQQTRYLKDELKKFSHLDVLDFEFNTTSVEMGIDPKAEKLDVDLFVRDKSKGIVYAIQLKHVSMLFSSGVSFWVNMLLHYDRKLNVGVLQLQNLKSELAINPKALDYLIAKGLTKEEVSGLIPVLVHNIGAIDMIPMHEGIWVYDLHTFRKVLTDQSALTDRYDNGSYASYKTNKGGTNSLRLDQPKSIIDSYINDENFKDLRYYDFAKNIRRGLVIGGLKIVAEGIGI